MEKMPLNTARMTQLSDESSLIYGPLFPYISDPYVEEIWINSPHQIFIARNGVSQLTPLVLKTEEVQYIVERALMWGGRRLDLSHPFVDARLPDGSRLHVAIPEVTAQHWAVNIRKHRVGGFTLAQLTAGNSMSPEIAQFLTHAVNAGLNILVSGSTGAGKTTLLGALISAIGVHHRVITIEEVFELRPTLPDYVSLQTKPANLQGEGEIPLRRLIKESLRMRPSRLVVGEIRESESLDLLIALNSGIPGMATIHANSAKDSIRKIQTLPLLAGENITHHFIAPLVAAAIDIAIHVDIDDEGRRAVSEILHVTGRVEGSQVETEPLFTRTPEGYLTGLFNEEEILTSAKAGSGRISQNQNSYRRNEDMEFHK